MSKKLIYNSYDEIFFSRTKELALKRVQSTYDRGIDINAINERTGFTALMLATVFDHRSRGAIMEFLIKHGADLNAVGSSKVDRCTALHVAAQKGHYDAIEMLIKHGADPTKLDDKCCSPSQVSTFAYEQESDPGRQLLHLRCSEKLRSKENEIKSKRENNFLTPKKKEQIINQVLRRARTASTPNNDHRPTSPLRRNRFLSASISPSGRPPISPRSPFSTGGSPFNNRALPVSSKSQTPQNTPRKMNSKKVANLDDSFIFEDRSKPISSPPRTSSDLSDKSPESRPRHSSLVKSPTKENSTQTPREIETQTDPDVSEPIQVKTRIIKVPISPKPREIQRENNTFDLNKIQKSIDELTIQVNQHEGPLSNPPENEARSSQVDSPPPSTEIRKNKIPMDIKDTNPDQIKVDNDDEEKENIWNYFDKSIRVPNLDKTYALGPDDHILPDTRDIIDPEETLKPTQKKIEKRILIEVNESVYHGNETFIIGESDLQNESKSNLSNEKLNMTKMSSDAEKSQNSQQSIDTSGCLFESIKPKEYSINTILEETEESDLENQTKKQQETEISPRDITPFPSSIINLASLQPPTFTSYKSEIIKQPMSNEKLKNKSIDNNTTNTPVDDNNQLINQINLESGQNEEGHLSEESSEDENESAESFKLEFSFDPSQESSFSSRINETIEPCSEQLSSSRTSLLSESINLDEIDKMDPVELRKNLSKYQIKMPNLHNQKLIEKYRNELKDLTKKSRFGAIYSSELLKGFEVFPKRNDYQKVQERLLDTNNISSKTRSASKKYYNYVLLDPRTLNNLQLRSQKLKDDGKEMTQMEIIQCFVKSVFYVGKGCGARSGQHIKEAFKQGKQQSAKLDRINEILNTDQPSAGRKYGLVIQQFGHDYTNKQSLLQEAAIIKAIGITNLTNVKNERFGENWSDTEICRLGCIGLFNACSSYLLQPENFIYPENI